MLQEIKFFFLDEIALTPPKIYDGPQKFPPEFNTVKILLDGCVDAALDWREAHEEGKRAIAQGYRLFWDLDLGLFSQLKAPLSDQMQYMALSLSVKHFRETIWKEFSEQTVGISIYNGPLDFSCILKWDSTQIKDLNSWLERHSQPIVDRSRLPADLLALFSCDAANDYLSMIAGQLPGELPVVACFDIQQIDDPSLLAQLLSKERFDRLHRAVTPGVLPISALRLKHAGMIASVSPCENNHSPRLTDALPCEDNRSPTLGVCLPHCSRPLTDALQGALRILMERNIAFRIVPEATLTVEWDGLDHLVVDSAVLSAQGIRKLNGFCAAGGALISVGNRPCPLKAIDFEEAF